MNSATPIILTDVGIISALGKGQQATWQTLFGRPENCLSIEDGWIPEQKVCIGKVTDPLSPEQQDTDRQNKHNTRCEALLHNTFKQIKPAVAAAIARVGAARVGIVLGTSTSGTLEAEQAFEYAKTHHNLPDSYHYQHQEIGAPADYLAELSGAKGVVLCVSTACTSGAKALISAGNLIKSGIVDVVIAGGVDSLCRMTLNGFHALESLSSEMCNPFSTNRQGINIGEGCALFVMQAGEAGIRLAGFGESSDAHHMSAPHPEGDGAYTAMQNALDSADLTIDQIDYINLHGTATSKNDVMEAKAMIRLGAQGVDCSSTKPYTGHTLAGAGAIEAAICWLTMSDFNQQNHLPPHQFDGQTDPDIPSLKLTGLNSQHAKAVQHCLSNSFAFGGSNVSLLLTRQAENTANNHD